MRKNGNLYIDIKVNLFRALFFDKRMGDEVVVDDLGEEYKGYVWKIMGG